MQTQESPGGIREPVGPDRGDAEADVADGQEHRLDPRVIALERLSGWIGVAVLGVLTMLGLAANLAASGFTPAGFAVRILAWSGLLVLLIWRAQWWPPLRYRWASYRVDALGIELREGVWWRDVINVPRSRVQHTDVSQGPLERRYGLGTLVIYTAGTDHSRVSVSGLEHGRAMRIRAHLLPDGAGDAV
jgi:membrane protein YdbS with pleckstrin-like domain